MGFEDLQGAELMSIGPLLVLSLAIGIVPRLLLEVIEPAAAMVIELVGR